MLYLRDFSHFSDIFYLFIIFRRISLTVIGDDSLRLS